MTTITETAIWLLLLLYHNLHVTSPIVKTYSDLVWRTSVSDASALCVLVNCRHFMIMGKSTHDLLFLLLLFFISAFPWWSPSLLFAAFPSDMVWSRDRQRWRLCEKEEENWWFSRCWCKVTLHLDGKSKYWTFPCLEPHKWWRIKNGWCINKWITETFCCCSSSGWSSDFSHAFMTSATANRKLVKQMQSVVLGALYGSGWFCWAPAADRGLSSEENLDLSETHQRSSKDLVGLWRPWSSSETRTIHTSSTWCHGSKKLYFLQIQRKSKVWELISGIKPTFSHNCHSRQSKNLTSGNKCDVIRIKLIKYNQKQHVVKKHFINQEIPSFNMDD